MMRKNHIRIITAALSLVLTVSLAGCSVDLAQVEQALEAMEEASKLQNAQPSEGAASPSSVNSVTGPAGEADASGKESSGAGGEEALPKKPDRDIYIIYTSDVHCGVDKGFGYEGVYAIRKTLEEQGYATLLVDDGDFVQGEAIGTISKGEDIIPIMNAMKYDAVTIGNHEFDFGLDEFFLYTKMADFPIICCNFTEDGKRVFDPYIIKDTAGLKIAFVGISTVEALASSKGFIEYHGDHKYGFMEGDGTKLYAAVQDAVDSAREEGADYVYAMAHLGNEPEKKPFTYMDVIANTSGIDVFFDGHSHDTDQVMVKNKDGIEIPRSAAGTKLNCVGYSHIKAEDGSIDTGIWTWENDKSIPELLGMHNEISDLIDQELAEVETGLEKVVAKTSVDLTIYDPTAVDPNNEPIRIVRSRETNLGDLCADSVRVMTGSDIGIVNAGGVRDSIKKGDITYNDILRVHPFNNPVTIIEVTGQQMLDALEWSARCIPDENGGLFQVSGMSYEVDARIPSPCKEDDEERMTGIEGDRRVSNVMVGDSPIDPSATYTVAGNSYTLTENGDGLTAFDGATVKAAEAGVDSQMLVDYITDKLGGVVGEGYDDPYGQGRIVIND
ncbi:MAG: bifunctional metallophosphatase/5'-nucleotidase [Lachnospiraceae bacterium]|nr:bifunctional metallophosphatase/5'-nucleotidase [Lachnospiraceae bacterium]